MRQVTSDAMRAQMRCHRAKALGAWVRDGCQGAMSMSDVTRILSAIEQGDAKAPERLLPLVYDECASWLPSGWHASRQARRLRLPPWFTKLIFA